MKKTALVALLTLSCPVFADTPVTVLGLSLGGKVPAMKVCPLDADKSKQVCWVGPPFVSKDGARSGPAHVPNGDARPGWAAHVGFRIDVAKDGTLHRFSVDATDDRDKHAIAQSISGRFGLPIEASLNDAWPKARWSGEGIFIFLNCLRTCTASFLTRSAKLEQNQRADEFERKNAARPATP